MQGSRSRMSAPEPKLNEIIRKCLESIDASRRTAHQSTKLGVAEIYEILQKQGHLPQLAVKEAKSNEESGKFRAAGNTAYKAKDFEAALANYTSAVCTAEAGTEPIALAHANRSAVHYELQEHTDVINDVHHALADKYPDNLKHKLFERRAKSYMALSQYPKAVEDLKKAIRFITNNHQDVEKVIIRLTNGEVDQEKALSHLANGKMNQENVQRLKSLLDLIVKSSGKPNLPQTSSVIPKLSHKPSKTTKGAFPSMEIAVSTEMGKHIVATINISPGDILAVEKPYVSVLTPEYYRFFCDNCKTKCHSSIPCKSCNYVVFCSEDCRLKGWESHHKVECDLLPTVIDLGCQVNVLIGIRGMMKATRCGKELETFVEERKTSGRKGKGPKTRDTDFHAVHNLVTHEEDRSEVQMLGAMITVNCIIYILKWRTSFFGCPPSEESLSLSQHTTTANLILKYFMMAGCNAFEIGESTFTDYGDFTDSHFKTIGGGLYPTFCLLNHSCDPDVTTYMLTEETRILYAIKPIRKGDQIFISYGPEYIHHNLLTRQKELKTKYFFTCNCSPCSNDWPMANHLPEYPAFISHKVESTQGPRIIDTCNKLPEIVLAADKGSITHEKFQAAVQYLSLYHKYVMRPWKYYFAAQRVIRRYFSYKGKHNIGLYQSP